MNSMGYATIASIVKCFIHNWDAIVVASDLISKTERNNSFRLFSKQLKMKNYRRLEALYYVVLFFFKINLHYYLID